MKPKILIIDDNPDVIRALTVLFALEDIDCISALTTDAGLQVLNDHAIDLVIQDMNFSADTTSGEEGIALFKQIRKYHVDLPIVLLTAWAHLEAAVQLVKAGAADYLSKPWDDDKLLVTVKNLIEFNQLHTEHQYNKLQKQARMQSLAQAHDLCGLCYQSEQMLQLLEMATQVAHADVPVLITGPNGAGKEKIAEVIQANSSVKHKPFVKVNVGALPNELMEAELFGAEAGAFTGIAKRRMGRFEAADGGTLFLDEIGNLSLEGQKKLLRVLETGEFERLGSAQPIRVKVRVISATNADLPEAIKQGRFREDLYYRLNLIELCLQPLQQRKEDILPLVEHFLTDGYQLSDEAEHTVCQYHWPGNVRELQNSIKRAMLLATDKQVKSENLGIKLDLSASRKHNEQLNETQIEQALKQHDFVIARAAKQLGISRQALYRRMEKFGITIEK